MLSSHFLFLLFPCASSHISFEDLHDVLRFLIKYAIVPLDSLKEWTASKIQVGSLKKETSQTFFH